MEKELEVKILNIDVKEVKAKLENLGARFLKSENQEKKISACSVLGFCSSCRRYLRKAVLSSHRLRLLSLPYDFHCMLLQANFSPCLSGSLDRKSVV